MRKSAKGELPLIRRIHFIKSAFDTHAFVIITFGKGRSHCLLHVFNDNLRILKAGHSLYSCECCYHKETDTQFHSSIHYDFDNPKLLTNVLEPLSKDNPTFKKAFRDIERGIIKALESLEVRNSKYVGGTEVHSFKFLYSINKNGTANHDSESALVTWSSDFNAFIGLFKFKRQIPEDPQKLIELPAVLSKPKLYYAASEHSSETGGPIPIDEIKLIQAKVAINLVAAGRYEIETSRLAELTSYSELSCDISSIMENDASYSQMICEESIGNFMEGLTYQAFPQYNIDHADDRKPMTTSVIMFDDNRVATMQRKELFSIIPLT